MEYQKIIKKYEPQNMKAKRTSFNQEQVKITENTLLISKRYLKEVNHSINRKYLNDANIKNRNWNISSGEKDWMLWLAD